jgi:hypothetical protein
MVSEVGILLPLAPKMRLLVRLMVRLVEPEAATGTVITTGDQPPAPAFGFKAAQVAAGVGLVAALPQL